MTQPRDLDAFLRDSTADGYPATEIRFAKCGCGADVFAVAIDDNEGAASRTCVACKQNHLLCDSAEYWEDAEPEECACPCAGESFNLAVGFALTQDGSGDVRWIHIGLRCVLCGELGLYGDWKIDYGPSAQLMDQV
jgi:hypothetical protein